MGWRNPLETSEFEIQVEVYNQLKKIFKNVRGEFHFKHPDNPKFRGRFDVAILDSDNNVQVVIEVKRGNKKNFYKQCNRYRALTRKPVVAISGMDQARRACELVEREIGIPVPAHGDIYNPGYGYKESERVDNVYS